MPNFDVLVSHETTTHYVATINTDTLPPGTHDHWEAALKTRARTLARNGQARVIGTVDGGYDIEDYGPAGGIAAITALRHIAGRVAQRPLHADLAGLLCELDEALQQHRVETNRDMWGGTCDQTAIDAAHDKARQLATSVLDKLSPSGRAEAAPQQGSISGGLSELIAQWNRESTAHDPTDTASAYIEVAGVAVHVKIIHDTAGHPTLRLDMHWDDADERLLDADTGQGTVHVTDSTTTTTWPEGDLVPQWSPGQA